MRCRSLLHKREFNKAEVNMKAVSWLGIMVSTQISRSRQFKETKTDLSAHPRCLRVGAVL